MERSRFTVNLSNIRTKIRTYQEQGKDVLFSAIFITGREKNKLIDRAPVQQLSLITKNLKYENPDKMPRQRGEKQDSMPVFQALSK